MTDIPRFRSAAERTRVWQGWAILTINAATLLRIFHVI